MQQHDYSKALQAWNTAAAAGESRAQYSLGYLYQFGLGVTADFATARDWYEKAAAQNNPDALYALGILYEAGRGVPRDLAQAMDYYRKAANTGAQPDAEYAVGRMILRGRGVPRDPKEGLVWLKKAAQHDQPAAQYMLGAAYEAGWGVAPDPAEALYWYTRSNDGDVEHLHEEDMAFQPKIAIASLRRHLSADVVAAVDARVKRDTHPPAGKHPAVQKASTVARTQERADAPAAALTRPAQP